MSFYGTKIDLLQYLFYPVLYFIFVIAVDFLRSMLLLSVPHWGLYGVFKNHKDVVLKYVIILQESYSSSRAVYVASRLEIAFIGTPNIEQQQQNCHSKEVDDTSCMKKTDNFLL